MPPTVIQRARRQSRTMALPQQLTSHPMTLDTSNQAPHPSFPFLMPPPNPSWGTVKPVTVSSTCNAQLQALTTQSSPAPLQQQHQCSSPLDPSSPPKSQKQGNIEATKPVQEANDKGPCTPPQQPLGEKNMSPNISFSNALQETNSGIQSAPLSQGSLQKSAAKVPRPHKENCPPVSSEMPQVNGLGHTQPMMRRNQASKKRAFSSPTQSTSPKKRKSMPVPVAAPKETPQCPQVPSGSPSSDFLCSSMNSEDQNKELFSNQVHLEDTSNEVPSKLEADLCSSQFGSPELHSTDSLWILPENTPRDLSSTHGNSADLDPLSSSLPSASHLDKDSGFNLIESGDSQGCGDNLDMSEPLISIDDILEWEGCCFGDLMSDMLSDNMKDSSTTEDCLTDLCTSSRFVGFPPVKNSFCSSFQLIFPIYINHVSHFVSSIGYCSCGNSNLISFLACAETLKHLTGLSTTVLWRPLIMKVSYPSSQVQLPTRIQVQVKLYLSASIFHHLMLRADN